MSAAGITGSNKTTSANNNHEYEQPNVLTQGPASDDGPMSSSSTGGNKLAGAHFKTFLSSSNNYNESNSGAPESSSPGKGRKSFYGQQ